MKTKLFFFILILIPLGLVSCANEDNERFFLYQLDEVYFPDQPISSTAIEIIRGRSVGITGGTAPYTATITNEQIANVNIDKKANIIYISPVNLGATTLTVADVNGLTTKIEVKVVQGNQSFGVNKIRVDIAGIDGEAKAELEKKVITNSELTETGSATFIYDRSDSGTLTLKHSKESNSKSVTAPFTSEIVPIPDSYSRFCFYATYNGKKHSIYLQIPEKSDSESGMTRVDQLYMWLVEDVTDDYKIDYPDVTSIKRICEGYFHN